MEIFDLDKVSYTYRDGKRALNEITLKVSEGEGITIIGTNGSGKSTLLYILDGLIEPDSGEVTIFGVPIRKAFPSMRQRISLLFQNPQVQLFSLTVKDELSFGPEQMGLSREETDRRVEEILRLLKIEHLRDDPPWNLSGGEMKKVALGTCLSINPDVLLLDEPTTGLDPRSQVEIIDIIMALRDAGKTVITATHDLGIVQDISDRTIVLDEDHRIIAAGRPWDIVRDSETLLRANLIHKHTHRHSWYVHEHSHAGIHDHEHIPDLDEKVFEGSGSTLETQQDKEGLPSEILNRLQILTEHWKEHNIEHAETYIEWAERTGDRDISDILRTAAAATKDINLILERLQKMLNR